MLYTTNPLFGSTLQTPIAVIPVTTSGAPYRGPYTKAVVLTPGTPVAVGRGAIVKGSGNCGLKLLYNGDAIDKKRIWMRSRVRCQGVVRA